MSWNSTTFFAEMFNYQFFFLRKLSTKLTKMALESLNFPNSFNLHPNSSWKRMKNKWNGNSEKLLEFMTNKVNNSQKIIYLFNYKTDLTLEPNRNATLDIFCLILSEVILRWPVLFWRKYNPNGFLRIRFEMLHIFLCTLFIHNCKKVFQHFSFLLILSAFCHRTFWWISMTFTD